MVNPFRKSHRWFADVITGAVFLAFASGHAFTAPIAFLVVLSSHGTKALLHWIDTRPYSATEQIKTDIKLSLGSRPRDTDDGIEPTP